MNYQGYSSKNLFYGDVNVVDGNLTVDEEIIANAEDEGNETVIGANHTTPGNLTVNNLTVTGDSFIKGMEIKSNELQIVDPIIQISKDNIANNNTGLISGYSTTKNRGMLYNTSDDTWNFYKEETSTPSTTVGFFPSQFSDIKCNITKCNEVMCNNVVLPQFDLNGLDTSVSNLQTNYNANINQEVKTTSNVIFNKITIPNGVIYDSDGAILQVDNTSLNASVGHNSISYNGGSTRNTSVGNNSGPNVLTGSNDNVLVGYACGLASTSSNGNTCIGTLCFDRMNGSSVNNVALGTNSLRGNNTSLNNTSNNIAIGRQSLNLCQGGQNNVAVGILSGSFITTGDNNICIGYNSNAANNSSNTIVIGSGITSTASNECIIGKNITHIKTNTSDAVDLGTIGTKFKDLYISGHQLRRRVNVVNSTYITLATDDIITVTTTATQTCIIYFIAASTAMDRTVTIKDMGGAGTYNITLRSLGSDLVDGSITYVMDTNYQSTTLFSDGVQWLVI